jgi:hypothetical protein
VHADRLAPLHVVPDEHAIGGDVQQRLAGEVIPAHDAGAGRDAEGARGLQVVELRRA